MRLLRLLACAAVLLCSGTAFAQVGPSPPFKGQLTAGNCIKAANATQGQDSGAPCGSGGVGTVTSIDVSGGTTGLTFSGGPIISNGTITEAGTLGVANGGTGQTTYTNGQLLIGNTTGNTLAKSTLSQGSGITITNGTGTITIAAASSGTCIPAGGSTRLLTDNGSSGCTSNADALFTGGLLSLGTNTTEAGSIKLFGGTSGNTTFKAAAVAGVNTVITFPGGTTDFSATGGASQVVQQTSSGGAFTVGQLACASLSNAGTSCTVNTGTSGATIPLLNGTNTWSGAQTFASTNFKLGGAGAGVQTQTYANSASSTTITWPAGTTDFSATGGASQVILQTSSGGAFTVARLACADLSNSGTACTAATGTSGATLPFLNGANTWSGVQTYTNSDIKLLGSSTGATTFTSANAGSSNFTLTFPAATDTLAVLGTAQTFTALETFTGSTTVAAVAITNAKEPATISATAATGTITFDVTTQSILYYTSNAAANWTLNIRANSGHTLDSIMSTGDIITITFMVTQGASPFYNNVLQVDGSPVTPKCQGGTCPSAGNASGVDVYTYAIIKTGSATFTALESQTQFK